MLPEIFGMSSYQLLNVCATLQAIIYITIFLKVKPKRYAFYTGIMCGVLGIVGARLLMTYELHCFNFRTIFRWNYGMMDLGGAFLALPICLVIAHKLFKIKYKDLFEVMIEALIIAAAIAKLACFCAGCCGGIQTDVPWAIKGRHPVQLYETAIWIIVYIAVILTKNKMNNINRICLITIGCIAMRMPVETFRNDANFFINGEYWLTYKILLIICTLILIINNRKKIKMFFNKVAKNDNGIKNKVENERIRNKANN